MIYWRADNEAESLPNHSVVELCINSGDMTDGTTGCAWGQKVVAGRYNEDNQTLSASCARVSTSPRQHMWSSEVKRRVTISILSPLVLG
jgi:hypothetical protein